MPPPLSCIHIACLVKSCLFICRPSQLLPSPSRIMIQCCSLHPSTIFAATNHATQLLCLVSVGMCSRMGAKKLRSKEMLILKRSGGGGVGGVGVGGGLEVSQRTHYKVLTHFPHRFSPPLCSRVSIEPVNKIFIYPVLYALLKLPNFRVLYQFYSKYSAKEMWVTKRWINGLAP
jgi:hypothetical protein